MPRVEVEVSQLETMFAALERRVYIPDLRASQRIPIQQLWSALNDATQHAEPRRTRTRTCRECGVRRCCPECGA